MSYNIIRTSEFTKHLKQLAKKYPSLKRDYEILLSILQTNPTTGTSLGQNCYKLRWKISSKQTGKSGGARVITYVKIERKTITLLDVYDKADKENITEKDLSALLKKIDD
ncbi:MAG: type II toxin-antitoxin system RelE/ParE family toxin [Chitinophagaceae bacterium]|nr:type II toxin-antitoxin system RelE/ParE family toxin [Chitinophagaceae bacterium]